SRGADNRVDYLVGPASSAGYFAAERRHSAATALSPRRSALPEPAKPLAKLSMSVTLTPLTALAWRRLYSTVSSSVQKVSFRRLIMLNIAEARVISTISASLNKRFIVSHSALSLFAVLPVTASAQAMVAFSRS